MIVEMEIGRLKEELERKGWEATLICGIRGTLFDIIARKDETLILIKFLSNVDSLKREIAHELKALAVQLGGTPVIIGEKNSFGELLDGVIYYRYNIPIVTLQTFLEYLEGRLPCAYSGPGGVYVRIDGKALREKRTEMGLSLGYVAWHCKVSRKAILGYERDMDTEVEVASRLVELFGEGILKEIDFVSEWKPDVERYVVKEQDELVSRLINIGMEVTYLRRQPVRLLMEFREEEEMNFIGNIGRLGRTLKRIGEILEKVSEIVERDPLLIVENGGEKKEVCGVAVISRKELTKIEDVDGFLRLLKKRGLV